MVNGSTLNDYIARVFVALLDSRSREFFRGRVEIVIVNPTIHPVQFSITHGLGSRFGLTVRAECLPQIEIRTADAGKNTSDIDFATDLRWSNLR